MAKKCQIWVVSMLLTLNASAWMEQWAPQFKFAPAQFLKLSTESVGDYGSRAVNGFDEMDVLS